MSDNFELLPFEILGEKLKEDNQSLERLTPERQAEEKQIVEAFESKHSIYLPDSFKSIILTYDLNNFLLGGQWFGGMNYKSYAKEFILDNPFNWSDCSWNNEPHLHMLFIANGDPYCLILNSRTGELFAMDDESPIEDVLLVAKDFEHFLRARIMAYLMERKYFNKKKNGEKITVEDCQKIEDVANKLSLLVGGEKNNEYWLEATGSLDFPIRLASYNPSH